MQEPGIFLLTAIFSKQIILFKNRDSVTKLFESQIYDIIRRENIKENEEKKEE